MTDDYVKPPKQDDDDYVAPPGSTTIGDGDYVMPTSGNDDDYVAPPKNKTVIDGEYVLPPAAQKQTNDNTTTSKRPATDKKGPTSKKAPTTEGGNRGYFQTPKQSWRFYLTGYLVISLILYYVRVWSPVRTSWLLKLFWLAYILLSNYTFSWFSDYQRFKDGAAAWFFTPYGSVKSGLAYASMMSYQTGSVKKTWTGNYKMSSHASRSRNLFSFVIVTVVVEVLKYLICAPLALLSIFLHKNTVDKYFEAVNAAE